MPLLLVFLLVLAPSVNAVEYQKECVGNKTIRTTIVRNVCDEDGCYNISVDEDNVCEYGCIERNEVAQCDDSPMEKYGVVGIILIIVFVTIYLVVFKWW